MKLIHRLGTAALAAVALAAAWSLPALATDTPTVATVGVGQGAQPQTVYIQDRTGAFVPAGTLNSNTHTYTPPGGVGATSLTLAQVSTAAIGANQRITLSGFRTAGDLGQGCVMTSVGATSTGNGATRDINGVLLNLTFDKEVSPGCFGAYADDGAHTINSTDISNHPEWRGAYTAGETWDFVATQEAIYAAYAQGSTPGSIVWNYTAANYTLNKKLFIPSPSGTGGAAKYGINAQLLTVAAFVSIEFANADTCWDWKGATNVSMWKTDSIAYGKIDNVCIQTSQTTTTPGGAAPLWDMDHTGAFAGLATQQLIITNANIGVSGFNNQGIAINPVGGGSAQGSTIVFINPEFSGFAADYCLWANGANALGIQIVGGDFQGCSKDAIRNTNGAIFVRGTTFEDQQTFRGFAPVINQITTNGADFHSTGDFGGFTAENKLEDVRSESLIGMLCDVGGNCLSDDLQVNGGDAQGGYFTGFPYYLGNVAGITSNGVQHAVMMVNDGGPATWLPTDNSSTACSIVDNTVTFTSGQWNGYILNFRFSNGSTFQTNISATAAHALTLSPCLGFTPPTGAGTGLYHISGNSGSSAPNWNSLSAGHYVTTLNGSIGFGFATTAGSAVVSIDVNTLAIPINVGDYVVIPGADEICNIGNCVPYPLYAKVLSITSGPPSTVTVDKAAALTVAREAGYFGTPLTDNQVKWIDVPFPALFGLSHAKDTNVGAGLILETANLDNSGGAWLSWNKGPDSHFSPVGGSQQSADYVPRSRTISPYAASLTGGTLDLTTEFLLANDIETTLVASTTVTIPTTNLPTLMARDETLVIRTIGVGEVLTFGSGFNTTIPAFTSRGTDEVVFRFEFNPLTSQWDEVSGLNLSNLAPGSSGQLIENSGGQLAGFTAGGDCTFSAPNFTCAKTGGTSFGTLATANAATPPAIGGTTPAALTGTAVKAISTIGYATGAGAGGVVTQLTSRATGVMLNNATGEITLFNAAGSATPTTFTVTNSAVAGVDTIVVNQKNGTNLYELFVTAVGAGSFNVTFFTTGGTATDAPIINFSVLKGAAS